MIYLQQHNTFILSPLIVYVYLCVFHFSKLSSCFRLKSEDIHRGLSAIMNLLWTCLFLLESVWTANAVRGKRLHTLQTLWTYCLWSQEPNNTNTNQSNNNTTHSKLLSCLTLKAETSSFVPWREIRAFWEGVWFCLLYSSTHTHTHPIVSSVEHRGRHMAPEVEEVGW